MSKDPITGGRPVVDIEMTPSEEQAMDRRIEAVRTDVRSGRAEKPVAGPIDPYDLREHRADQIAGRKASPDSIGWRKVMETRGFRWYEPAELTRRIGPERYIPADLSAAAEELAAAASDRYVDAMLREEKNAYLYATRPHRVGQWRNDLHNRDLPHDLRMAFTEADLLGMFGSPEHFDAWIDRRAKEYRARLLGIRLP